MKIWQLLVKQKAYQQFYHSFIFCFSEFQFEINVVDIGSSVTGTNGMKNIYKN